MKPINVLCLNLTLIMNCGMQVEPKNKNQLRIIWRFYLQYRSEIMTVENYEKTAISKYYAVIRTFITLLGFVTEHSFVYHFKVLKV